MLQFLSRILKLEIIVIITYSCHVLPKYIGKVSGSAFSFYINSVRVFAYLVIVLSLSRHLLLLSPTPRHYSSPYPSALLLPTPPALLLPLPLGTTTPPIPRPYSSPYPSALLLPPTPWPCSSPSTLLLPLPLSPTPPPALRPHSSPYLLPLTLSPTPQPYSPPRFGPIPPLPLTP